MEYGNYIWDNCFECDKDRLEDFQLSIARTVTGARKGTSHNLIYNELNWPTLADRRKGVKLKIFFKIINNETPEFLRSLLPKRIGDVRPQSRNPDNYYTVKALDVCDRTLTYVDCLMKKPQPLLLYHGSRKSSVKHAQLRMKCSKLNYLLGKAGYVFGSVG